MSGQEILEYVPNMMKYGELENMSDSEIVERMPLVVLYEFKEDYGHWCLLTNTVEGIEFFDSYSFLPDSQREFIDEPFKSLSGQSRPRILKLLKNLSNFLQINYMDFQLQGADTATCGRWCCLRYLLRDLSVEDFLAKVLELCRELNTFPDNMVTKVIPLERPLE